MSKIFFGLLSFLCACGGPKKIENEYEEFDFKSRLDSSTISDAYACGFSESDTIANGGTYRLKLYLANRTKVYNPDTLNPVIKYKLGEFISWEDVRDNGISVPVLNDTGLVKVFFQDSTLKKGQIKEVKWYATVTIPLPDIDTTFAIRHHFFLRQK